MKKQIILLLLITCSPLQHLYGIFPVNVFRPWDIFLRPTVWPNTRWQYTTFFEHAYLAQAENPEGDAVNPLQIYQPTQSSISMLKGFPANSDINRFLVLSPPADGSCPEPNSANGLGNPEDNGVRGHLRFNGDFDMTLATGISVRYHFPENFTLGIHLPVYSMGVRNVTFQDLTRGVTAQDLIVKRCLAGRLNEVIAGLDPSLNINGWKATNVGDLVVMAEWIKNFPQQKSVLKNVMINPRFAVLLPSGRAKNENDILSMPFGCDGSTAIFFGGGIALTWLDFLKAGIDYEFWVQFGNTRSRRIKVQEQQTEWLLFAKVLAHNDPGFTERFHLYLETPNLFCGFNAGIAYQFWKHNEDKLSLCTNDFSQDIANTAQYLKEWSMHHALFKVGYDLQYKDPDSKFKPQFMFFYKYPFNGKRSIMLNTVGASFSLSF